MAEPALEQAIRELKVRRQALILAHSYQVQSVQRVADFVGDSLELALRGMQAAEPVIVFCGVRFMAETAAILSPEKTVLLPEPDAGCPLADMALPEEVRAARAAHPDALIMAYVNTSAAVKAECDICCTSANALSILEQLGDREVVYLPDQNLAQYAEQRLGRPIRKWRGFCLVHHLLIRAEQIVQLRAEHPAAVVLAHPECRPDVLALADHVLGTGAMLRLARQSEAGEFIVATEIGMVERLARELPEKRFYPVAGAICQNMKRTSLESVRRSLERMEHRVVVPEPIAGRARAALNRMLEMSR